MDKLARLLIIANNYPDLFDKYVECIINNKEELQNHEIINQIFSLLDLPQGWNYGEGDKIKEDVVLISLIILENAPLLRGGLLAQSIIYENVEAFLLSNGGISLRIICKKDLTIGLLINSEDNIGVYIDDGVEIKDLGVKKMSDIAEFLLRSRPPHSKGIKEINNANT